MQGGDAKRMYRELRINPGDMVILRVVPQEKRGEEGADKDKRGAERPAGAEKAAEGEKATVPEVTLGVVRAHDNPWGGAVVAGAAAALAKRRVLGSVRRVCCFRR